jgi:hypothetical protein
MCIKRITSWLLIVVVLVTGLIVPTKTPTPTKKPESTQASDEDN